MAKSLFQTQETIEQQCQADTILRNTNDLTNKVQINEETASYYGSAMIKKAIEPYANLIATNIAEAQKGKVGKRQIALDLISNLDPHILAFIAAKTIIDRITGKATLQNVAVNIGNAIDESRMHDAFQTEKPYLFKKVFNEASDNRNRRSRNLKAAYNRYFQKWSGWSKSEKLHIGIKLIDLFTEATGFVEVIDQRIDDKKTIKILVATTSVCDYVERNADAASLLNPIYLPMVVKPQDWSSPYDGGYLTHYTKPLSFVKTPDRNYLEELSGMSEQMGEVYRAINIMQSIPWRINPFVYVPFLMIFERGMAVRRDQLMQDELKRMHMQHKAGFAILTGHNLQDTSGSTYRW